MNTALGNCVLASALAMRAAIDVAADSLESGRIRILCDGDDLIAFMDRSDVDSYTSAARNVYTALGHVLRVENVAYAAEQVEFCQHKPLQLSSGRWVMVPDPRKVLQTAFMATGHYATDVRYFGTLWAARARVHCGVPVYQALFSRLAREHPDRLNSEPFFGFEVADPGFGPMPVLEQQRAQFARQWDFPLEEQLLWETATVDFQWGCFMGDPADWGKRSLPQQDGQKEEGQP